MSDFQTKATAYVVGTTSETPAQYRARKERERESLQSQEGWISPEERGLNFLAAEERYLRGEPEPELRQPVKPSVPPLPVWATAPKPTGKKAPPPIAYDTPARANLGAAIDILRIANANLEEIRATARKAETGRAALRRELDTAKRIAEEARQTEGARSLAKVRDGSPLGEDTAVRDAEAAVVKVQRDLIAADKTSELLEAIEREADFTATKAKTKIEEALGVVALEAVSAIIEKGRAAQQTVLSAQAVLGFIRSSVRVPTPEIDLAIVKLSNAPGFNVSAAEAPWADYVARLREDANAAQPE